eukprot:290070_1
MEPTHTQTHKYPGQIFKRQSYIINKAKGCKTIMLWMFTLGVRWEPFTNKHSEYISENNPIMHVQQRGFENVCMSFDIGCHKCAHKTQINVQRDMICRTWQRRQ